MPVAVRTKGNNPLAHRPNQIRRGPLSSRRIIAIAAAAFVSGIGGVRALRLRRASASAFAFATAAATRSTTSSATNFPARGVAPTQRAAAPPTRSTNTAMDAAPSNSHEVPPAMRGLFAGSGVEGLSHPLLNGRILNLLPDAKKESPKDVRVLYLGTATYDLPLFREKQTARFVEKGCRVSHLDVARDGDVDLKQCAEEIERADVLLVGGGNTLYAVDRWFHLGLVPHMRKAMERGCVLAGGSAGAICWFDSGHSDSADPETYRDAMLRKYGGGDDDGGGGGDDGSSGKEDESSGPYDPTRKKEWRYLRCPGLGFVPGPVVCCPHHDKTQSNGLLRADDFDGMLLARAKSSNKSVLGLGIDHYSAFVVEGEEYEVYAIPEKPGSVNAEGRFDVSEDGTPNGRPGVWLKRVIVDGGDGSGNDLRVEAMVCPPSGKVADLLAYGGDNLPGQYNEERDANQAAVDKCRKENPSGRQF